MSSGFVSGGTSDKPTERDDEWLKAQQEIEENRRRKEEEGRQQGGKSLYEVLQNNKAAKEEAFQESIKLKNQFRNLDEDEVEFLDSVLESTRAKEQAVKRETAEQLDLFRRQQEEAGKVILDEGSQANDMAASPTGLSGDTQWTLNARKRKRKKDDKGSAGVKVRKSSSTAEQPSAASLGNPGNDQRATNDKAHEPHSGDVEKSREKCQVSPLQSGLADNGKVSSPPAPKSLPFPKPATSISLGLADYGSDDD